MTEQGGSPPKSTSFRSSFVRADPGAPGGWRCLSLVGRCSHDSPSRLAGPSHAKCLGGLEESGFQGELEGVTGGSEGG